MTEPAGPRGRGGTANLLSMLVYFGPGLIILGVVIIAVVLDLSKQGSYFIGALYVLLAASVVYLAFMGGARWGDTTSRRTGRGLLHSLASIASWAVAGTIVGYALFSIRKPDFDQKLLENIFWALGVVIVVFAFLLVLDGLNVFRPNGERREHTEFRFFGSAMCVLSLVVALVYLSVFKQS